MTRVICPGYAPSEVLRYRRILSIKIQEIEAKVNDIRLTYYFSVLFVLVSGLHICFVKKYNVTVIMLFLVVLTIIYLVLFFLLEKVVSWVQEKYKLDVLSQDLSFLNQYTKMLDAVSYMGQGNRFAVEGENLHVYVRNKKEEEKDVVLANIQRVYDKDKNVLNFPELYDSGMKRIEEECKSLQDICIYC